MPSLETVLSLNSSEIEIYIRLFHDPGINTWICSCKTCNCLLDCMTFQLRMQWSLLWTNCLNKLH